MDGFHSRRAVLAAGVGTAVGLLAGGCLDGADERAPIGSARSNSFVLRGVRVFDGERVTDADSVVVERGLIGAVGRHTRVPADAPIYDGAGGTVVPGLMDAHVHTFPGGEADAARFGVTTMLDMFSSVSQLAPWRALRRTLDDVQTADVWGAGTLITAAGGHGTQYSVRISGLEPGADTAAFVADRVAEGSDFIKIVIEDGSAFQLSYPTLTATQVTEVVAAAHARGLLAVVHVTTTAAAAAAVTAGADLLVHVPVDGPLDARLIDDMRARRTGIVATLAVHASGGCTDDATKLSVDPRISQHLAPGQRDALGRSWGTTCLHSHPEVARANVAALHRVGVPVLAGTDAGNPGTTYGASIHEELDLLVRAGLGPTEALTAATALRDADRAGEPVWAVVAVAVGVFGLWRRV